MKKSTTNYDMFKFRSDNRAVLHQSHIDRLIKSIQARNLLEMRPIIVNEKMEVMDGQNRLLAAKKLGVPIWYVVEDGLCANDIILMNTSSSWKPSDYLNFYIKHQNDEYIKLARFMEKHNFSLRVAINICIGQRKVSMDQFKKGEFKFPEQDIDMQAEICHDTIAYIKKVNGYSPYTESARFWKALLKLVQHADFIQEHWLSNLSKMSNRLCPKASYKEYLETIKGVYNFHCRKKITFDTMRYMDDVEE